MNDQEVTQDEVDALIRNVLARGGDNSFPSPINELQFSERSKGQSKGAIPDDEVVSLFRYKAAHFLTLHRQHIAPVDPARPIPHLGGSCSHLRDKYRATLTRNVHKIRANVNSNAPYERLCIACIRQRRNLERYQCTLCGGCNPTRSQLMRRTAVEITPVEYAPLVWHVPMCRRCRHVLEMTYNPPEPSFSAALAAEQAQEVPSHVL